MSKVIMIGCDLHDSSMLLKVAKGTGKPVTRSFPTAEAAAMIGWVQEFAAACGASRIVFAYEASGQGFGLYDDLTDAGVECHVLAPTHLQHSPHRRKNKTDDKDALMILDVVRGYVLAGTKLPRVWVPDPQTRDDREAVRLRLEVAAQRTRIKNQIRSLAKRWKLTFPPFFSKAGDWSKRSLQWLREVAAGLVEEMGVGFRVALASLVHLYEDLGRQLKELDAALTRLAGSDRYRQAFRQLKLLPGVGTLTALVFLTELGDLNRFANRRQLAAYLGLVPAAYESGEVDDRKGHITHQGPSRVRHMLCQASWAALRCSATWRETFQRIKRDSPRRSKIAIVAVMRRLGILMWQTARSRQLEELLNDRADGEKASARARQKGSAPPPVAVASTS